MLTYQTKITSSSPNIELRCLLITFAIIFLFNTPVSYIKLDQLKKYQLQLKMTVNVFSKRVLLINNLLNHISKQYQTTPPPLNKNVSSSLISSLHYIQSAQWKPPELIHKTCGPHYPSTLQTDTLFIPTQSFYTIYKPLCHNKEITKEFYLNLDLKEITSFPFNNLALLSDDGTIYTSQNEKWTPGLKLSELYPKIWNELSVLDQYTSTFSTDDMTIITYKLSFVAGQTIYIIQIINDDELIPPYFYIFVLLLSITVGFSYYLFHLRKEKLALAKITYTDQLSGLYNRHYLSKIKTHIPANGKYYFCLLDIDHFKKVNDKYGHDVGDQVIKRVANVIKSRIKLSDYAFRFGGEEFLIILKNNTQKHAIATVEHIRYDIENIIQEPSISVSGGLCRLAKSIDDTIKCADAQLYVAKKNGRNLIIC